MSPAPILSQERPSSTWGTCSQGGSGLVSPLWVSLLYLLPNFLAAAAPSNTGAPLLQASFSGPPEAHSTQLPSQLGSFTLPDSPLEGGSFYNDLGRLPPRLTWTKGHSDMRVQQSVGVPPSPTSLQFQGIYSSPSRGLLRPLSFTQR